MVRPRSQQVDNLKARYSKFSFTPSEFASQQVFSQSTIFAATVSDSTDGAAEPTYATITSSAGPFAILAGDSFSIAIDGAGAFPIVFASTDTTASRIAAKINTTTSSNVATASAGILTLRSPTLGENGSLVVADVVSGTLAKLGITAGSVTGTTDPVRGVVTRSTDGRGGKVLLRTSDGKIIESDSSAILPIYDQVAGLEIISLEKPGGIPLYARLTLTGAGFVFKYYTEVATRPEVETFNSNFSSLDNTDTFNITVVDANTQVSFGPVAMTFPTGPGLTRDQVLDRINFLWAFDVSGTSSGDARCKGSISGPYNWDTNSSTVLLSVDGGADQTITFLVTDTTAQLVADRINASTTGCTASVVSSNGKQFVQILSDNTNAASSSLELKPPLGGFSDVFKNLGIPAGKYLAPRVAVASGTSEIKIVGIGRGDGASVVIASGNATTLTRMGLVAGTYTGSDNGEEEVNYPIQDIRYGGNTEEIVALIPEVLDFGEIPTNEEADVSEFLASTPGDNILQSMKSIYYTNFLYDGLGIRSIGKSANTSPNGSISYLALARARQEYENVFKQILKANFNTRQVTGLVTNNIENSIGNPLAESNEMLIDVDPDDDGSANRSFRVQFGRDGTPFNPFYLFQTSTPVSGVTVFADFRDNNPTLGAIANSLGTLRFYDSNTEAAGTATTTGTKVIPLSSGASTQGDSTLRIMDRLHGNLEPISIFRQVNARFTVTVGDGTNSFGDFNGNNSIQQAIAFFITYRNGSNTCHIKIKRGTYTISAANGAITVPADAELILEGEGVNDTEISLTDSTSPAMSTTSSDSKINLKNVKLTTDSARFLLQINADTSFEADNILSTGVSFEWDDGIEGTIKESTLVASANTGALLHITCGDGVEKEAFIFEDCNLTGFLNQPILRVSGNGGVSLTPIRRVTFNRCNIVCGGATVTGGNLAGNSGVIDITPTTTSLTGFQGTYLRRIEWLDCDVTGNATASACTILMHLIPIPNASATTVSPYDATASTADLRIDDVVIRGGRWYMPPGSTTINPFTIGLAVTANQTDSKIFGKVTIEDWIFEVDRDLALTSFSHGSPSQDVQSFFTSAISTSSGPLPIAAEWGAIAISAMELTMNNIKINGFGQLSDSGELFLKADRIANINNVYIGNYTTGGPGAAPQQRVRTRFGDNFALSRGFPKVSISNIVIKGSNTSSGSWVSQGIIAHEPGTQPVIFNGVSIFNFLVLSSNHASNAFKIMDGGFGDLYNSSSGTLDGLVLKHMDLRNHGYGIFATFTTLDALRKWSISECDIRNNTNYGVSIQSSLGAGSFIFDKNTLIGNNAGNALGGVLFQVADWSPADPALDPSYVIITGNQCYDNGNAGTVAQFILSTVSAGTETPIGIAHGNNFTTNGLDGTFKINRRVGGVSTAMPSPEGYSTHPFRGCETGYRGETSAGFNTQVYRDTGNSLMQNIGRLESP